MSDSNTSSGFDFQELSTEGLNFDAIFANFGGDAQEPFATPATAPTESTAPQEATANEELDFQPEPTAPEESEENPIEMALSAPASTSEKPPVPTAQFSLFDKAPIFSYGGATEEIEDTAMTFEELRIAKAEDFPELSEGKKVSWRVDYGKCSKAITDPKSTTIASVKEELERSKAFLENLKKAKTDKEKSPACIVKPTVTMQTKGISAYKGVFGGVEEAQASDKMICLIPARDGKVYELRKTELGEFIAPKNNIVEFGAVRAGFTPALPLIPKFLMEQIVSFFRCFMNETEEFEALAHIYWDRERAEFTVRIPVQTVSKARIDADLQRSGLLPERYLHYADVHSHNSMEAKFSHMDDADELATRLYLVLGQLDRFYPTISARVSCGGIYQDISPSLVLESVGEEFPVEWLDNVTRCERRAYREVPLLDRVLQGLPEALLG